MATPRLREQDLAGKVALITGASRGIGRAIALHLATRGCTILGTCSQPSSLPLLTALADEVSALFPTAANSPLGPAATSPAPAIIGISADIFSPTCATTIADALASQCAGRVDIFVNNAADARPGVLGELTAEEVALSLVANVQTPVMIVDELVRRRMFRPDSRIVYISSVRSRQPWAMQLMYAAGKSAGESLCRTWAEAFGGKEEKFAFMAGTTANSVSVGLTQTDSVMQVSPAMLETFKQEFIPQQCVPRFGQPEDVADVVGLLCGRDGRWITGCVISASGGGIKMQ